MERVWPARRRIIQPLFNLAEFYMLSHADQFYSHTRYNVTSYFRLVFIEVRKIVENATSDCFGSYFKGSAFCLAQPFGGLLVLNISVHSVNAMMRNETVSQKSLHSQLQATWVTKRPSSGRANLKCLIVPMLSVCWKMKAYLGTTVVYHKTSSWEITGKLQEKPSNCETKAANVLANSFLLSNFNANPLIDFGVNVM